MELLELIQLAEVKEKVRCRLQVGKTYIVRPRTLGPEERKHSVKRRMTCTGMYRDFALFEDSKGIRESFLYWDLYKMFMKEEEVSCR